MFRVMIMYPNQEGATFDHEYYVKTHMKLVEEHFTPFGLIKTEVDKGLSGGGEEPAPYIAIGCLYFETLEGYDRAGAAKGAIVRGDIPNFTNVAPIRQISEVLN